MFGNKISNNLSFADFADSNLNSNRLNSKQHGREGGRTRAREGASSAGGEDSELDALGK
jgi:hypothetical protein